ncbi:hypothetical protein D9756_006921 [Leucocoprinus leucothites]|uniref:Uncharacterized protein n=1 Tax=Leucocoprinus leucothites TaxID=201217 RepID=A0A8H5D657_9AGAR|nr:hypothetical protein D9756_006921 [Leucoagaricus leucothites]
MKSDVPVNYWLFHPARVKQPITGAHFLFVSAPNPSRNFENGKELHRLLVRMSVRLGSAVKEPPLTEQRHEVGVKSTTHIWIHDTSRPLLLTDNGNPRGWSHFGLERDSTAKSENMVFLSLYRTKASWEEGQKQEMRIRRALGKHVEGILAFGKTLGSNRSGAWYVIEGIMELIDTRDKAGGVDDRSKWLNARVEEILQRERKKAEEDNRVRLMQHEIGELYEELSKTEYGKGVRANLRRVADEQKKMMEPLLAQMDNDDLKPEEKEQLEKTIEEEYHLFLREFRFYFAEARQMRITIGPNLREFYGLLEPVSFPLFGCIRCTEAPRRERENFSVYSNGISYAEA